MPHARIPTTPGYQAPFAERIKRETGILTGAVGMITEAEQAEAIIRQSQADVVLLARAFLRDPVLAASRGGNIGCQVNTAGAISARVCVEVRRNLPDGRRLDEWRVPIILTEGRRFVTLGQDC